MVLFTGDGAAGGGNQLGGGYLGANFNVGANTGNQFWPDMGTGPGSSSPWDAKGGGGAAAGGGGSNDDAILQAILSGLGGGGSSGGGGGSSLPDWYYQDQSDLDWANLNEDKSQNAWNQQFADAQFKYQQSQDAVQNALDMGNFGLAKQKQADANYWQGKTMEAEERMNNASNSSAERRASIAAGAEVQSAQISAQAQIQSAEIRAAVDRQASNQQLQANLANAVNDADRNAAMAAWNREQAQIAKMEDDTKRIIAENDAKINLFGAETDRMGVAGQLAQKQNEFILNAATSPKDLFGLYFMQRGLSPDWETMAAGGQPGQGSAIVPQNALTAYTPQAGLPQLNFGAGPSYGGVGSATAGYSAQANPFISMGIGGAGSGGGAGGGGTSSGGGGSSSGGGYPAGGTFSGGGNWSSGGTAGAESPVAPVGMPPQLAEPEPQFSGIRDQDVAGLTAGQRALLTTGTGGTSKGSDYANFKVFNPNTNTQYGADDVIGAGSPVWLERNAFGTDRLAISQGRTSYTGGTGATKPVTAGGYQGTSISPRPFAPQRPATSSIDMPKQQQGFTTAPQLMTGDSTRPNPFAGGARPEIIENPTGAPLRVQNSQQTAQSLNTGPTSIDYPMPILNTPPQQGGPQYGSMPNTGNRPISPNAGYAGQIDPNAMRAQDTMWREPGRIPPPQNAPIPSMPNMDRRYLPPQGGNVDPMQRLGNPQDIQAAMNKWNMMKRIDPGFRGGQVDPRFSQPYQKEPWYGMPQTGYYDPNQMQMWGQRSPMGQQIQSSYGGVPQRFALGTDPQQQYADSGLGHLWQGSSGNEHLQGVDLPNRLNMLNQQGVPLSPSLVAGATGQVAPTLALGGAFTQRGGGMLPSLQSLNRMTSGERENFQGYSEGVVGVPWRDTIDYLSGATAGLKTAQRSRGAY